MKLRRLQKEVNKWPDKPKEEGFGSFGDVSNLGLSVPHLLYDLVVVRTPLAI